MTPLNVEVLSFPRRTKGTIFFLSFIGGKINNNGKKHPKKIARNNVVDKRS